MSALSDKRITLLGNTIKEFADRVIYHTVKHPLTHKQLMELFVAPEDFDAVQKARKLFRHTAGGTFYTKLSGVPDFHGEFNLRITSSEAKNKKPFMHPHYMGNNIYVDREHEAFQTMLEWVNARTHVGNQWGLVLAVLNELNHRCETAAQMRFFWPGLATLAGANADLQNFADQMRDSNTPAQIPRLPPELREACKTTMQTLTMATLLPKETPAREASPVEIEIFQRPFLKRPWGGDISMPFF